MSSFNLPDILDEVLILHAVVAAKLLAEFPGVYGVRFHSDRENPSATPRIDAPDGYSDGYRDKDFESRAKELMVPIFQRVAEGIEPASKLGVSLSSFDITAERSPLRGNPEIADAVNVSGAIIGGLGSVMIMRRLLISNTRVIALAPSELHVIGLALQSGQVGDIESACKGGIRAAMKYLIANDCLLNQSSKRSLGNLKKWIGHFPEPGVGYRIKWTENVCRIIWISKRKVTFFAVPCGTFEGKADGSNIIEYDQVHGLALERRTSSPA